MKKEAKHEDVEFGMVRVNKDRARKAVDMTKQIEISMSVGEIVSLLEMVKRGTKGTFVEKDPKLIEEKMAHAEDLSAEELMLISTVVVAVKLHNAVDHEVEQAAVELAKREILDGIKKRAKTAHA